MIALSLKLDLSHVWENSGIVQLVDGSDKLQTDSEQNFFDTAIDVATGVHGITAQRQIACNSTGALYLHRYVGKVMKRRSEIKRKTERAIVEDAPRETAETLGAGVPERMLCYFDDGFEAVCRREEAVELLKQLKRVRAKVLCMEHKDLYVLLYNLYNAYKRKEDNAKTTVRAVDELRELCSKYDLKEFLTDLLYNEYISIEEICCSP